MVKHIGSFLHGISGTMWSDRVESVKPFAAHLPSIKMALEELLELNLTAKSRNDVKGALSYVTSFICIIMFVVWYKVLVPIELCKKVIQARDATLDVKVSNVSSLLNQISEIRSQWKTLWYETKLVTYNLEIEIKLSYGRNAANRKKVKIP